MSAREAEVSTTAPSRRTVRVASVPFDRHLDFVSQALERHASVRMACEVR
jgi:hypothetical protein